MRLAPQGAGLLLTISDFLIDFQPVLVLKNTLATLNILCTKDLQYVLPSGIGHFGHRSRVTATFFQPFAQNPDN